MSTATGSASSMRQQLDELDALLQRMLSLPINQLDETPPPEPRRAPEAPRPTAPRLAPAADVPRMRLLADSSPVLPPAEPAPTGQERPWAINLNPQNGSSILGAHSPVAPPARPSAPEILAGAPVWRTEAVGFSTHAPAPEGPPAVATGPIVTVEPLPESPYWPTAAVSDSFRPPAPVEPAPSPALLPLVWFDKLFDAIAMLFGAPGEWLSGPSGKSGLGFVGLLLLAASAAWGALGWFGWTW